MRFRVQCLTMALLAGWMLNVGPIAVAQTQAKKTDPKAVKKPAVPNVPATHANVPYGKHERQVLDFYQAKSDKPTPLVFFIHGGGWRGGDKAGVGNVKQFLDVGISVAAINYRYVQQAEELKVEPPVKAPLEDAARALQFVRSKAGEWNIDKKKIGATGGSAGGCSSLWLAFHPDMADPNSADPIARESTRLYCAAVNGAQVSLDPKQVREWLPNWGYGAHAFGLKDVPTALEKRDQIMPLIKKYSPIEHASEDDPPIGLFYTGVPGAKAGEEHPDPTHSPILGEKLAEHLKKLKVDVVMSRAGAPDATYKSSSEYLLDRLRK